MSYDFITVMSANLLKFLSDRHLANYLLFLRQAYYKNESTVFFIFKDMPEVRNAVNQYFIIYGNDNRDHDSVEFWNNFDEDRFNKRKSYAHTRTMHVGVIERAINEGLIFDLYHINYTYKGKEYVFIKSEKFFKIKSAEAAERSEEYRLMLLKSLEDENVDKESELYKLIEKKNL